MTFLSRAVNLRSLLAAVALCYALPATASQAVVVELYRDCQLADTTVLIEAGALTPAQSAEVKARAAAAAGDPGAALPRVVSLLKRYGIDDVEVTRQGFGGCEPTTSGKFVEAVGTYCGGTLTKAELRVDRETLMSRSKPDTTFEEFLKEGATMLRERGIYDRPVVSIENAPDCDESS